MHHDATQTSTNRYQTLFDFYLEPSVLINPHTGLVEDLNAAGCRFLAKDKAMVVGQPFELHIAGENPPDLQAFAEQLRVSGRAGGIWSLILGTGDVLPVQVAAQSLDGLRDRPILMTLQDPTVSVMAGGTPADTTAAASDMSNLMDLQNELNNPLQEILSWIELQGNPRLKHPAGQLIEILNRIRGDQSQSFVHRHCPTPLIPANRCTPCTANRVLIVDDETNIRNLFNNILRLHVPDLVLDMADNGKDAITAFEQGHHCLILLDLKMPNMNGESVLRRIGDICQYRKWETPQTVLCTGYDARDVVNRLAEYHLPCAFLQKPVTQNELVSAVTRILEERMAS